MPDASSTKQILGQLGKLVETVGRLDASLQSQTATFEGFQRLVEVQIANIDKSVHTLKNDFKVQDGTLDRIERELRTIINGLKAEISDVRHEVKTLQTKEGGLAQTIKNIRALEARLRVIETDKAETRGESRVVKTAWNIFSSCIGGILGYFLKSHSP